LLDSVDILSHADVIKGTWQRRFVSVQDCGDQLSVRYRARRVKCETLLEASTEAANSSVALVTGISYDIATCGRPNSHARFTPTDGDDRISLAKLGLILWMWSNISHMPCLECEDMKSGPCFGFVSQAAGSTYQTGNCMTSINATERSVSECTWWYAVSVGESINLACQKQVSVKPVDLAVMSQILTSCLNKIPHGRRSTTPNP
jgi:hypothetical protein